MITVRVCVLLVCAILLVGSSGFAATVLHVSTSGRDAWSGKLAHANSTQTDGPLATLAGARDALRRMRVQGAVGPVEVVIEGGTYRLSSPLVFTPEDSGASDASVTFRAAAGAKPVISGGKVIKGWEPGSNGLWTARVPKGEWSFSQMFVNGVRRSRTRLPQEGYFRVVGRVPGDPNAVAFKRGDIKEWKNLDDVNVVVMHPWETSRMRIRSVDSAKGVVNFTTGGGRLDWWLQQNSKPCYYVENVYEALGQPGQWYLDRKAGVVYYKPLPGEDMRKAEVVAPVVSQLIAFEGRPESGKSINYVNLVGLSFEHADWQLEPGGHGDAQAACGVGAVIHADGISHCAIRRCSISRIGTYAIWLRNGCVDNVVDQCEISDAGAGGVRIADQGLAATEAEKTARNTVRNCFIHDCGVIYPGSVGIFIAHSQENTISHNELCDLPYSAISLGWRWDYGRNDCERNVIEYNRIYRQGQGILTDGAGIYTLGECPGTIIRNNVIHDILAGGIYPDMATVGSIVENNLVYRCLNGAYTMNWGRGNLVRNNIFGFCPLYQIVRYDPRPDKSFVFERNIVIFEKGRLMRLAASGSNEQFDHNLYWRTDGESFRFAGNMSHEGWLAAGKDVHSAIADPLLLDPKHADFRLRPTSDALKMGFVPFDASRAGLEGESSWVDAPKLKPHKPFKLFIPGYLQAKPIRDDFESTQVGQTMRNAYAGEEKDASVRVTAETAASGKHSLKFTDTPGLQFPWNPHLNCGVRLWDAGAAECRFDLRLEQGASLVVEWRDDESPYQVGPHISASANDGLMVGDRRLMALPVGKWIRVQISSAVGRRANGAFELVVTPRGEKPRRFPGLTCEPHFVRLDTCVFISSATDKSVFYIDNLSITALE